MLKISFGGRLGLSAVILTQFTLEMCLAISDCENKFTKDSYFGVEGRSRSSMLIPPKSLSAVLVMMRSKSVFLLLEWTTVAETVHFEGGTQI